jgi:tetratricopeptide (TPR) repeat protein
MTLLLPVLALLAVPAHATPLPQSPAEQRIAAARAALARTPDQARPHVELARALARRARETADPAFYRQATEALEAALRLHPADYEARKMRVWVLLGQHEFARALEEARPLNREAPDDILVYGFLADAHAELGQYEDAEKAVQWMLDLRPGNVPALTRGAYLRELFGDVDGALEFMTQAFDRTPPEEVEDRAWILTQIGHLYASTGKLATAETALLRALELFPRYHYALAQLARVRAGQGKHAEAASLLRERYQAAPHPENLYDLAEALHRAGRIREARAAFAEFERKARAESEGWDNANRELIAYYADRAGRPSEALRLARREIGRRRDVHTRDAFAWALHRSGRSAEAKAEMEAALAVGVRDARLLYHAGVIASAAGDGPAAARYLRESLAANPASEVATDAGRALARVSGGKGAAAPRS